MHLCLDVFDSDSLWSPYDFCKRFSPTLDLVPDVQTITRVLSLTCWHACSFFEQAQKGKEIGINSHCWTGLKAKDTRPFRWFDCYARKSPCKTPKCVRRIVSSHKFPQEIGSMPRHHPEENTEGIRLVSNKRTSVRAWLPCQIVSSCSDSIPFIEHGNFRCLLSRIDLLLLSISREASIFVDWKRTISREYQCQISKVMIAGANPVEDYIFERLRRLCLVFDRSFFACCWILFCLQEFKSQSLRISSRFCYSMGLELLGSFRIVRIRSEASEISAEKRQRHTKGHDD
jgi:hypothetical protein